MFFKANAAKVARKRTAYGKSDHPQQSHGVLRFIGYGSWLVTSSAKICFWQFSMLGKVAFRIAHFPEPQTSLF